MEKESKVEVYKVEYECDECKNGTMLPYDNVVFMSDPPQYPHECTSCGHKQNITGYSYPIYKWK